METIRFNEDVYPISEFRTNTAGLIDKIKNTKRPILLTQNGKGTAILLDVKVFDELIEKTEFITGIAKGLDDIQKGKIINHSEVKRRVQKYTR